MKKEVKKKEKSDFKSEETQETRREIASRLRKIRSAKNAWKYKIQFNVKEFLVFMKLNLKDSLAGLLNSLFLHSLILNSLKRNSLYCKKKLSLFFDKKQKQFMILFNIFMILCDVHYQFQQSHINFNSPTSSIEKNNFERNNTGENNFENKNIEKNNFEKNNPVENNVERNNTGENDIERNNTGENDIERNNTGENDIERNNPVGNNVERNNTGDHAFDLNYPNLEDLEKLPANVQINLNGVPRSLSTFLQLVEENEEESGKESGEENEEESGEENENTMIEMENNKKEKKEKKKKDKRENKTGAARKENQERESRKTNNERKKHPEPHRHQRMSIEPHRHQKMDTNNSSNLGKNRSQRDKKSQEGGMFQKLKGGLKNTLTAIGKSVTPKKVADVVAGVAAAGGALAATYNKFIKKEETKDMEKDKNEIEKKCGKEWKEWAEENNAKSVIIPYKKDKKDNDKKDNDKNDEQSLVEKKKHDYVETGGCRIGSFRQTEFLRGIVIENFLFMYYYVVY